MKIFLTTLNIRSDYPSLALLYLKAALLNDEQIQNVCEVSIEEFNVNETNEIILSKIEKYQPQVVAFSCYVWNIEKVLAISSKLKSRNKNLKIILGGPQVSPLAAEVLLENESVDFIIRGEGEVTFPELIRHFLLSSGKLQEMAGISFKKNRRVINNQEREIIRDLDSISSPFKDEIYESSKNWAPIETHRGCAFNCYYCYYNKANRNIRYFSLGRVKKDMAFLLRKKIKQIYLMDPTFNFNAERTKEICRFIIDNNKNNVVFNTEVNAELVDEEMARLFHDANIKNLEIGLQSIDKKVLMLCNRHLNLQTFVSGVKALKKYDINIELQLIMGLPGQTEESFKDSLDFVLELNPTKVSAFSLQVLPGTVFWEKGKKLGLSFEPHPPYRVLRSNQLSANKMSYLAKLVKALNLIRNKLAIKVLSREANMKIIKIIELWIDWLKEDGELLMSANNEGMLVLQHKFKEFFLDLCKRNMLDVKFYKSILGKKIDTKKGDE
jgi:radical SAM superfamily enzyme YgiQ (UPF0313 family)